MTGARRGELCALQWEVPDLNGGVVHRAFCCLVLPGVTVRKDTRTPQDRYLAIDKTTTALLTQRREPSRLHSVAGEST